MTEPLPRKLCEDLSGPPEAQHSPAMAALIHAAAVAFEVFGDDELERWAEEDRRKREAASRG